MAKQKPMSQEEYRVKGESLCPACGGNDIEGSEVNIAGGYATQEARCSDCEATWTDIYYLEGYEDLHMPEKITCPECGYTEEEGIGFSYLAHGCNGIEKGSADDIHKLECGKCKARFDPPAKGSPTTPRSA